VEKKRKLVTLLHCFLVPGTALTARAWVRSALFGEIFSRIPEIMITCTSFKAHQITQK
jgi:hypothetical protein